MKTLSGYLIISVFIAFLSAGCGDSGPVITDDQVLVKTAKLDITFSAVRSFSGSYMIFGGATLNHGDAFFNVSLAGLDITTARSIYARYPDFDRCNSPGAPIAQQSINQFDIVPASSGVSKVLKKALAEHKKNTAGIGENVCVTMTGRVLRLRSAVLRDINEDITAQLPPQVHQEYFLVESARLSRFQEILTASLE